MQQWNLKLCNLLWERIVSHVDVLVGFGMLQGENSKRQWPLEIGGRSRAIRGIRGFIVSLNNIVLIFFKKKNC